MRTDLKVNYEALLDLSDHLKKYQDDAEAVEKELNSLNSFLDGQKSKALKKLKEDINEDDEYFVNLIEELKDLKQKIKSYVSCMEKYVTAETPGEITRVDTIDIKLNLDSMKSCVEGGGTWFNDTLPSGSYIFPDDKIKRKEQKNKYERNYNKLENYRKSYLAPLKQRLDQGITDLYKIYDDYLVPFEDEDDNHRKKLNKSYKKYTSTWNKIKNGAKLGFKIGVSFSEHFISALVIVLAIALIPEVVVVAAIAAVAIGATIAAIPKKYFGGGLLKKIKVSVDEKVNLIKQGPIKIIKVMANDMADTVQTPEGVAGVVGDVAGMVVGGKIAKAIKNPKTPVSKTGETSAPVEDAKIPEEVKTENIDKIKDTVDDIKTKTDIESKTPDVGKTGGGKSSKIDYKLLKDYVRDVESKTGKKIPQNQMEELKNALRNREYTKLTPKETAKRRIEFNKIKNQLIKEWETNTGQKWPTYTEDVISPNTGKVVRKAGDFYDAHHIIENSYGGEHEWWNIHPAKFPNEHQAGIHGGGSPASKLFSGDN